MSYEILQSTKVFRITDGTNEAYISGSVSESSNVSPKRYNTISFNRISRNKLEASLEIVKYVRDLLSGCIRLKNGDGKTVDDEVNTIIRRFLRNVQKAKTLNVDQISIGEDLIEVTYGNKFEDELKIAEPMFKYHSVVSKYPLINVADNIYEYRFLIGKRSVADAIKINHRTLSTLFNAADHVTKEDFIKLVNITDTYYIGYILRKTSTRLDKELDSSSIDTSNDKFKYHDWSDNLFHRTPETEKSQYVFSDEEEIADYE